MTRLPLRHPVSRPTRRLATTLLIGASILALLVACTAATPSARATGKQTAAPASAAPTRKPTSSGVATPTVNPTDAINATTVLPPDFPPEVPLIEGDILSATESKTGWIVWVKSSDPLADYQTAVTALRDAGFTATSDQTGSGSSNGVFTDPSYSVTLSAGAGARYPNAVGYTITKQ